MLAPMKLKLRKGCEYLPIFIQVKTYAEFTPHDETAAKSKMENAIKSSQIKRGMCLLLVAGQLDHVKSTRESTIPKEKKENTAKKVVYKTILIPTDDCFEISQIIRQTTNLGSEFAEVFASHSFIPSLFSSGDYGKALRSSSRYFQKLKEYLERLDCAMSGNGEG